MDEKRESSNDSPTSASSSATRSSSDLRGIPLLCSEDTRRTPFRLTKSQLTGVHISQEESQNRLEITDEEWTNASRALRTASWGACIALYTVFGFMAGYSGYLLWHVFLGIDSYQFPARNYGDLGFRTWGTTARYITNIIQALGLLLLLGQVTIQYGENISQVSKFRLCYVVCPVLFVSIGFFLIQIRTLKAYGWIANLAISTLGSAGSVVDPDSIAPDAAGKYPPIIHYAGLPTDNLVGSINGLLSGVLAYAGAQLFVEFMAEMKRPRDFLKAMWGAQLFIYTVYLVYGCFVYHYQGQYSNMLSLIAALIAAGLYGNIGIKVIPPLITTRGKILYAAIVPIWWSVAFVIAAAIPDYFGFVSIISASCLLNLTYTLPPFFALGYDIQCHAILIDEHGQRLGFDPFTGHTLRKESTVKRWTRGFMARGMRQTAINCWHVIYFFASLSMSGLGMYAAIEGMIEVFKIPHVNSFSCKSPLNLNA
ncbi:hypothetical protein DL98DRAFT_548065 [Cadophora sp. DSE1049]|nr:hypothetical protein DL98DRAFT_548065 [Cadophora sp. DSE1049]